MLALERVFSVLIKLQTSLMLSFTFELFIEISFRYVVATFSGSAWRNIGSSFRLKVMPLSLSAKRLHNLHTAISRVENSALVLSSQFAHDVYLAELYILSVMPLGAYLFLYPL
jgi:hypothetical protein